MILDSIDQAQRYYAIHQGLQRGFEYLLRSDLAQLSSGRHEIDGDRMFAIVARDPGRGRSASPLEFHRRYLDIQYVVEGRDLIGWSPLAECRQLKTAYDASRDIGFFDDVPGNWFQLAKGHFAIFFPDDAHAPMAGEGALHKVVIKVQC